MSEPPGTSPDIAPVDAIHVGERDRTDMGNLDELAESITAVGLLHPIVVTADLELVAGGRRLAAVKQLGWSEVPVTVVDITSLADTLRAEADENTCRKGLDPIEASIARQRRARLLAPVAAERKAHGKTAPGRPAKQEAPSLFVEAVAADASANFAEASKPKAPVNVRRDAAIGTGYSHASIDKVDEIRQIAERGTRTVGSGSAKREEAVPETVREVAAKQIPILKSGAAIQPAHQAVRRALDEYVGEDPAVKDAKYWEAFTKSLAAVTTGFLTYDPTRVAILSRDTTGLEAVRDALQAWFDKFDAATTGGTVMPLRRSS